MNVVDSASNALQDLSKSYGNHLDNTSTSRWLSTYSALYERRIEFPLFDAQCNTFSRIYSELENLVSYMQHTEKCKRALLDLREVDIQKKSQLLDWLIKYEDFGLSMEVFFAVTSFQHHEKENKGYIPLIAEPMICVKTSDYSPILDFVKAFSKHYWEIIEDYAKQEVKATNLDISNLYYGPVTKSLNEYVARLGTGQSSGTNY